MNTSKTKKALPVLLPVPGGNEKAAELVGEEILHRNFNPGAWAKALVASGDNESDATREYARIRLDELTREDRHRRAKAESLELRRLRTGSGVNSVKDLLNRGRGLPDHPNVNRPGASITWLFVLLLGSAGSCGCLMRLFALEASNPGRTPMIALLFGAIVAGVALLLWIFLPKHLLRLGYNFGLGGATAFTCMLSLILGVKLMAISPQLYSLNGVKRVAISQPATANAAAAAPAMDVENRDAATTASVGVR